MKLTAATFALLLLAASAFAAEIAFDKPVKHGFATVSATGLTETASVFWDFSPDPSQVKYVGEFIVLSAPPGVTITAKLEVLDIVKVDGKSRITRERKSVPIVFPGEEPVPVPVPPGPGPAPKPPTPVPSGDLRVLFLYESSKPLTSGQAELMIGTTVRKWLDSNCVVENGLTGYRYWDKDTKITTDLPVWRDLLTEALKEASPVPKMLVFRGPSLVAAYPWPENPDAAVATLRQYGK